MIALDRKSKRALHQQIYDAFRDAIVSGRLRAGQRVPSTRVSASELGVSRFPVLTAYSQLLAEGYFESHVGSGTVVSSCVPETYMRSGAATARKSAVAESPRPYAQRASIPHRSLKPIWLQGTGAFAVGQVAFDQFPHRIWSSLIARRSRVETIEAMHYGEPTGLLRLREAVADYLRTARSVRCDVEQILIVSGSQQALDLSARVLVDAGDGAWVEEPGYRPAREVFRRAGCRLVPVPVDGEGMNVAAGIDLCHKARVAIVTPSHQLPLGVTMSARRRLQLLDWALGAGAWIIEDDYDSEYRYDSTPVASLQGLDRAGRVIYIGTFSKVLFPSLRLGYIVVPEDMVQRFAAARAVMDSCPPNFFQDVTADFIFEGHFARHLRRMRSLYSKRRGALADCLRREFGPAIEVIGNEAGMFLAAAVRNIPSDMEIAQRAEKQNLRIWPLSSCYVERARMQGFVLGFGNTPESQIPAAVRKLRGLLTAK